MRGGREPWPLTSSVTLGVFLTSLGFGCFFSYGYSFFFLAVLGLCCCAGFSLVAASLLSSCSAQASHDGGFSSCRAQARGHRLNSSDTWA